MANLRQWAIEQFPGIRLDLDPSNPGVLGARDSLNLVERESGFLETRNGLVYVNSSDFVTSAAANGLALLPSTSNTTAYIYICRGGELRCYKRSDGSLVGSSASAGAFSLINDSALLGDKGSPTTNRIYFSTNRSSLYYATSAAPSTFTQSAGSPDAKFVAAWAFQGRLVAANYRSGAVSGPDVVGFSDAGLPDTWGANNYERLTPGDRDEITAIEAWRDYIIVFKRRRFFVFYGVGEDASGNPTFDYRIVDTGIGAAPSDFDGQIVASTPKGVYFVSSAGSPGIYLTDGGPPIKVSQALDPLFSDNGSIDFSAKIGFGGGSYDAGTFSGTAHHSLTWLENRLYWSVPNFGTFELNEANGSWRRHDYMGYVEGWSAGNSELIGYSANGLRIVSYIPKSDFNLATDYNGTPIAWAYQLGPYRIDDSNDQSVIRRSRLAGTGGPVLLQIAADAGLAFSDTGESVALSASRISWAEGYGTRAYRGRSFSTRLSGTGYVGIGRLEHHLRRQP